MTVQPDQFSHPMPASPTAQISPLEANLESASTTPDSPELNTTVRVLDSLVAFYYHERMWLYRQRAFLDSVFDDPYHDIEQDCSSSEDDTVSSSAHQLQKVHAKKELFASSTVPIASSSKSSLSSQINPGSDAPTSTSRWHTRKRRFRLRLDKMPVQPQKGHVRQILPPPGCSPQPSARELSPDDQAIAQTQARLTQERDGVHLLDMFENVLEARLESCQRVNRLIRHANRRDVVCHGGVAASAVLRRGIALPHASANSEV